MRKFYLFTVMWVALLSAKAQQTATFEEIELQPGSFYNGSDGAGGFISGGITFPNSFNGSWGSWSGFSVSNMKDTITAGYANQYSAITAGGADSSENYAVVYYQDGLKIEFNELVQIDGFHVTNTVYSYLSMRNGDDLTKKFGGAGGTDPDYFLLKVSGVGASGNITDSVKFYLADFRSEDPGKDYILNQWVWLDLKSLGVIGTLKFHLESTDIGDWGMNTPAYFCIDNLKTTDVPTLSAKKSGGHLNLNVFPNPVKDVFQLEIPEGTEKIILTDGAGRIVFNENAGKNHFIRISALSGMPSGAYFLIAKSQKGTVSKIIMKY